ncbi:MAG: hypothetical protein ABIN80_03865 [Dyadobacter sp.]|uniref:hypothetical protein n=1 Tax=Dyadobacter sp. TaxID=1914288 RepID=UPI003267CD8D
MKKSLPIALLALLLYHTFGLSFAILFFGKNYQVASISNHVEDTRLVKMYLPSLPYTEHAEVSGKIEGLVRKDGNFYNPTSVLHENDTLYITLKSNQAARDHFFELANAMQVTADPQADLPGQPYGKMIKLLGSILKNYVSNSYDFTIYAKQFLPETQPLFPSPFELTYRSFESLLSTPPPELS